jgi:hypothetical protein
MHIAQGALITLPRSPLITMSSPNQQSIKERSRHVIWKGRHEQNMTQSTSAFSSPTKASSLHSVPHEMTVVVVCEANTNTLSRLEPSNRL